MSNFANQFKEIANVDRTLNGAVAYRSTGSEVLNAFANIGGMRDRTESDIIQIWKDARNEDKELADNLILYARNIRETGLGERRIGRILLKELAKVDAPKVARNLQTVVDAGRWDDLFVFIGTPVEKNVWDFIETQIRSDIKGMKGNQPISLLAKWMPSINTSSQKTRMLARKACTIMGLTERTYRKTLSALRKYINVVERLMSAGEWDKIDFESVPSVAMSRYIATYNKRCQERFAEYKASLVKGEAKVNATTLYPYDIVKKALDQRYGWRRSSFTLDEVDEAQWKALPNYVDGSYDIVIMADVSGSMCSPENRPMATSIGLATYFAQRNQGAYHGMYLSFTNKPHFITINDSWSLAKCIEYVENKGVGYDTNLDAGFKAIYEVAKETREVPAMLAIISDMEINSFCGNGYESIVEKWKELYAEIGLKAPKLLWWNVNSRGGRVLAKMNENVAFVSGYGIGSFSQFKTLIEKTSYEAMVDILTQPQFTWK